MKRTLLLTLLMLLPAMSRPQASPAAACCDRTVIRAEGFAPPQPVHTAQTSSGVIAFVPLDGGPPPGPRSPRTASRPIHDADAALRTVAVRALQHGRLDRGRDIDRARSGLLSTFSNTSPPALRHD